MAPLASRVHKEQPDLKATKGSLDHKAHKDHREAQAEHKDHKA